VHSLRETSIDMSMIPWQPEQFRDAVRQGLEKHLLSQGRIEASVRRVLELKHRLGLLNAKGEDGDAGSGDSDDTTVGADHEASLQMARETVVLAKNGKTANFPVLPVASSSSTSSPSVLVTGPTSNSLSYQCGGWTGQWQGVPLQQQDAFFTYGGTVLGAFSSDPAFDVSSRCGVDILGRDCGEDDSQSHGKDESLVDEVKDAIGLGGGPDDSIGRAVAAASNADVVIVCIGEESYTEKPGDIRSLQLPEGQTRLVRDLATKTKDTTKVVVVYFGGRPRLLRDIVEYADAVLLAMLPGPFGGRAVVDIISGRTNPNAKLPFSWPKYEDGGGVPYYGALSDQCTKGDPDTPLPHWEYTPCEVEWPFGHGLSYTAFVYSELMASGGIDEDLSVSVQVQNIGRIAGAAVVMVFTFDKFRTTTPEYKRLRYFDKIYLKPGQTRTVEATISLEEMKFVGPHDDRHYIIDPLMQSWVGVGSETDCRTDASSCVLLQSKHPDQLYIGACDVACQVWERSGCARQLFGSSNTRQSCLDLCTSISEFPSSDMDRKNDGWGWDYVNCIEDVVWGATGDTADADDTCWKLTSLCRDIFSTGKLDEFGFGPPVPNHMTSQRNNASPAAVVALFVAFASIAVMVFFMNGGQPRKFWRRRRQEEGIQFTPVNTSAESA